MNEKIPVIQLWAEKLRVCPIGRRIGETRESRSLTLRSQGLVGGSVTQSRALTKVDRNKYSP